MRLPRAEYFAIVAWVLAVGFRILVDHEGAAGYVSFTLLWLTTAILLAVAIRRISATGAVKYFLIVGWLALLVYRVAIEEPGKHVGNR